MGVVRRIVSDILYWIMPISVQPIEEKIVQHVTRYYMLDPDITVQIKAFDWALTEWLYNTNFIIGGFNGVGMKYEGSDMPQWDTWDPAYGDNKITSTETEYGEMI